jgi:hypothetical protein
MVGAPRVPEGDGAQSVPMFPAAGAHAEPTAPAERR